MKKINATTALGIASMILGVVGTLVSNVANQKQMNEKITDEVKKAIEKK